MTDRRLTGCARRIRVTHGLCPTPLGFSREDPGSGAAGVPDDIAKDQMAVRSFPRDRLGAAAGIGLDGDNNAPPSPLQSNVLRSQNWDIGSRDDLIRAARQSTGCVAEGG